MTDILIVEDNKEIAALLADFLRKENYVVSIADTGEKALDIYEKYGAKLIVLDIMLPGLNGLEVLRRLQQDKPVPVILFTARDAVMDKVAGLDAGAVDYITKPFAIEELLARIRVALKLHGKTAVAPASVQEPEEGVFRRGKLMLSEKRHQVTYDGQEITLTNREFQMLRILLENQDIVMARDVLLDRVCGFDYVGETNVVDVYIRFLRSKIDEVFGIKLIQTVRGVGYVIKSENTEKS